jgi:hypothetical protein
MHPLLEVNTDYGRRRAIQEHDLTSLTDAELKELRISRAELRRCFDGGGQADAGQDRERPGTTLRG